MQPYIEFNAHHIGNSHIQSGMSCEDYSSTYSDDQMSIIVVSDGHGDRNCFRSDRGAKCACETAVSLCRQFQNITSHIDDITQCDFESLVSSLESDIADTWKERVLADAETQPFSDEEILTASEQAQEAYRSKQRLEKAYGCTLILSMSTKNYWLSIQIGDGKSVAAYGDGVFVEPVPTDENCLGNRSTSLCNSNAKESFRHYYSKSKPIASFVSSDGVEESFDQAGLYNFFYSVAFWLKEEGFDIAKSKIEWLLPQISEGGSGDDVSIAIMVSKEETIAKPRQTIDQIYERVNACENALEQCKNLLADTKDRISEKSKECSDLEKDISKLKAELEEKENAHEQILAEQEDLIKTAEDLDLKTQRASDQMEKAIKYKASAERYWFAEFEKLGITYHPPVEETETNDPLGDKVLQEEKVQDFKQTEGEISPPANDTKTTMVKDEIEETSVTTTGEQENNDELTISPETDFSVAYDDAIKKLEQEQTSVETEEKHTKRFWPFSKQTR